MPLRKKLRLLSRHTNRAGGSSRQVCLTLSRTGLAWGICSSRRMRLHLRFPNRRGRWAVSGEVEHSVELIRRNRALDVALHGVMSADEPPKTVTPSPEVPAAPSFDSNISPNLLLDIQYSSKHLVTHTGRAGPPTPTPQQRPSFCQRFTSNSLANGVL